MKVKISEIINNIHFDKVQVGTVPYVEIGDVDTTTKEIILKDKASVSGAVFCPADSIIVSKVRPNRGAIAIVRDELAISSGFTILNVDNDKCISEFLFYYLAWNNYFLSYLQSMATGSTYPTVKDKNILNYKIFLPNILTQKRIIEILDKTNTLRQKRRQAIGLLDDYLKSVFVEMFADPVNNPKKWEVKEVGELCRVKIGPFGSLLHKEDYVSNGIPLVNPKHMINGKIIVDPQNCISKEKHSQLKDYHLKTNDLIMARRGEIGRCAVVTKGEDKFLCGTGSILLRPTNNFNNIFLLYLFSTESMIRVFEKGANGVTMQNLNAGTIKKTRIIYPSVELQNKFASIVRQTESLKRNMLSQSEELENQFQSMMQKAFKGAL